MTKYPFTFRRQSRHQPNEQGMILVAVLIISMVFTLIGLSLTSYITSQYTLAANDVFSANATMVAEAGIEQSIQQLNQNDDFAGYNTPEVFFNDTAQGYGTFTTTINNSGSDSSAKIITATGKVSRYGSSTPVSTRIIEVTVVGTTSSGYSVHSGPGGLILGGSANITNSDVYVNGSITLKGASKIGTSNQPLNVFVANDQCPQGANPGSGYPEVCSPGSGIQPISMDWSTHIYGTVCATGQTSTGPNNNITGGKSGEGLKADCTAPVVSTPTYDRQAQIDSVTTTASGSSDAYTCQKSSNDLTWPANLELTGNVKLAGSCNLTITGNTYITGNLDIGGAAKITVADSVGTTRPVVIVDGTITIGGSAQIVANKDGTGIEFISFKSSASCSPDCTSLSGTDLKTSEDLQTISIGGSVNLPGMVFDAYWGKIEIAGSGNIGAAIGQTVDMSGSGTVTFGTNLASGARMWTITSYRQLNPD